MCEENLGGRGGRLDPRWLFGLSSVGLLTIGHLLLHFSFSPVGLVASWVAAIAVAKANGLIHNDQPRFPWTALQTGTSTVLVGQSVALGHGAASSAVALAGITALGVASKELFRFRSRHIFNPSNFGLSLAFLIFPRSLEPLPLQWGKLGWGVLLAYALIGIGLYAGSALGVSVVSVSFWCVWCIGWMLTGWIGGRVDHQTAISAAREGARMSVAPGLLLFSIFMLPDPKTTPRSVAGQALFGVAVATIGLLAVVSFPGLDAHVLKVLILSLFIVCLARPLADLAIQGRPFGPA